MWSAVMRWFIQSLHGLFRSEDGLKLDKLKPHVGELLPHGLLWLEHGLKLLALVQKAVPVAGPHGLLRPEDRLEQEY